ncbi:MAG TPA: RluA family pseudouridine synthase, partial [Nitrospirales bacterium]|nr:RluA family pseudouridine synthase [Nitrospirales bacterium]
GDETYGGQNVCRITEIDIPRVMLHARALGFQHPVSGMFREYSVGFPLDMQKIRQALLNK